MANYIKNSHSFESNSFTFLESSDPCWELINPFMPINPSLLQYPNLDCQSVVGFSSDHHHILTQQTSQVQAKSLNNLQECNGSNKRKAEEIAEESSLNSSSLTSTDQNSRKTSSCRGKRAKSSGKKPGEKPEEVVHVRARRGQATDSHSIAERVRRGKINERLRCLQDIVPGCYKTMGMAVMLDEIINYVQSLQNQVEFLSMKLTAASQFHDFNAETDGFNMQKMKAQDVERILGNGGHDQAPANLLQPTWPF